MGVLCIAPSGEGVTPRARKTHQNKRLGRGSDPSKPARSRDVHSANNAGQRQITCLRGSAGSGLQLGRGQGEGKKQGRRRSIPSTTLPAPDIEIGSRHPVNCSMQRIRTGICEPVHTRRTKLAGVMSCFWRECPAAGRSQAAGAVGGELNAPVQPDRR